jgi:hypothetical protein
MIWRRIGEWRYEGLSKRFRPGRLERELKIVQLSATRCCCIAIFWGSLVSFATEILCVASQRVFIVVSIYLVIESVRKLLDTPSHTISKYSLPPVTKRHIAACTHLRNSRYDDTRQADLDVQCRWTSAVGSSFRTDRENSRLRHT